MLDMAARDVIVIGGSSGSVGALTALISGLPATLPAAVFVVVHVRPDAPSQLPAILNRAGALPVAHAVDREPIRRGRVYVAPPGLQTYLHDGRIGVRRGPHENLHRPAIDPLFRTAAHHYGPRVIGVVLSGAMDDGSAGLLAIKRAGGLALVQDPEDAGVPDMPANALATVETDFCVAAKELAPLLAGLVEADGVDFAPGSLPEEVPLETVEETARGEESQQSTELGVPSEFTCPDCGGTLFEIRDGGRIRYRCRVGHAYSEESMAQGQLDATERGLWAAVRALEERVAVMRKLADHARRRGHDAIASRFDERSEKAAQDARAIHEVITSGRALEPVGQNGI